MYVFRNSLQHTQKEKGERERHDKRQTWSLYDSNTSKPVWVSYNLITIIEQSFTILCNRN